MLFTNSYISTICCSIRILGRQQTEDYLEWGVRCNHDAEHFQNGYTGMTLTPILDKISLQSVVL